MLRFVLAITVFLTLQLSLLSFSDEDNQKPKIRAAIPLIAYTEDGRKVLLKSDGTWEWAIDAPAPPSSKPIYPKQTVAKIISSGVLVTTPHLQDVSISLGQNIVELEQLYGAAAPSRYDEETGLTFPGNRGNARFGGLEISLDNDHKVETIMIYDSKYKTNKGVGVGSLHHKVRIAYGIPTDIGSGGTDARLEHYKAGEAGEITLTFGYTKGKVILIALSAIPIPNSNQ